MGMPQNQQPEIDTYQVWLNKVDVVPAQNILVANDVVGNTFQLPDDLVPGKYKVWTRGFVSGSNPNAATVATSWSVGTVFETNGRPIMNPIGTTTESRPLISWDAVEGASSYEVYVAPASNFGSPIARVRDLTTPSYQLEQDLSAGDWIAWVRSFSFTGDVSPWSLTSRGRFSVNAVTTPVVNAIPTSSVRTPTFTWSATTGAARYQIYVSPVGDTPNPVINVSNVTGTTYTSTVQLAARNYNVWVRAISPSNTTGPWSDVVSFTITANDAPSDEEPDVMLAFLQAASPALQQQDVTVTLIPATVVEDSGRTKITDQTNIAFDSEQQPAEHANENVSTSRKQSAAKVAEEAEDGPSSDRVMAEWDDAIWAEESGMEQTVKSAPPVEAKESSRWLSGLALLSPAVFRRRRRNKED